MLVNIWIYLSAVGFTVKAFYADTILNEKTKQNDKVKKCRMYRQFLQGEFNIIVMKMELSIIMTRGISQSYQMSTKNGTELIKKV